MADKFFEPNAEGADPLLRSGILLASIVAVALNAFFNGVRSAAEAKAEVAQPPHSAEAH